MADAACQNYPESQEASAAEQQQPVTGWQGSIYRLKPPGQTTE
jgi:hypothetical protein